MSSPKLESNMNPNPKTKQDDELFYLDLILDILELSSCGIRDAGAKAFAIAIDSNPGCVMNLDLSNNEITDEDAIDLSKGLRIKTNEIGTRIKIKETSYYELHQSQS